MLTIYLPPIIRHWYDTASASRSLRSLREIYMYILIVIPGGNFPHGLNKHWEESLEHLTLT